MQKYLKDLAALKPINLKILNIGSQMTNRRGKVVRRVEFDSNETGVIAEDFLENTFKYDLKSAAAGDYVTAYIKDNGYLGFRAADSSQATEDEAASIMNGPTPTQLSPAIDRDLWISHQGFMNSHINAGKTNAEALQLAKEAYDMLQMDLRLRQPK